MDQYTTQFQTVDLDRVRLHYAETPGPGPALVILHGITGSHASFLPFMPALAHHAHVYAPDLRGHHLSGHTPGAYQVSDYGRDVAAFLHTVVGRPAFVAGHSLGGLVAVWLAAYAPEWVSALLLEDPPLYITQMPRLQTHSIYGLLTVLRAQLQQHHANQGTLDDLVAFVAQMPVNAEQTMLDVAGPALVRQRAVELHSLDLGVLDTALEGHILGQYQPDELLTQVRCPVHLLAGQIGFGGTLDPADVQRAISKFPRCTHTVFEGAGHLIHEERPEAYLQALIQLLGTAEVRR